VIDQSDSQAPQRLDTRPRRLRRRKPMKNLKMRYALLLVWRGIRNGNSDLSASCANRLFLMLFGVSRGTMYRYLAAYERAGMVGLADLRRCNGRRRKHEEGKAG